MARLVKMERDIPTHEGGPVVADVHPDNVEDMEMSDWRVVEKKKPKPKVIENEEHTDQI